MQHHADDHVLQLAETFRLLGDPTRLKIVLVCLEAPSAVADIALRTGASPSLVSHHLRLLRAARLVRKTRLGRQAIYAPADVHVSGMLRDMLRHVGEDAADADDRREPTSIPV